jgi:hypothetical protein
VNLRLFLRVIGRFRYLILAGLLLAILLSTLAMARVTFDGAVPRLEYRAHETWRSVSALLVTKDGFSYGQATLGTDRQREAEEMRFMRLAVLYARMAKSDDVRSILRSEGPIKGDYAAERSGDLPVVRIAGDAASPAEAERISGRVMEALVMHLRATQAANRIPFDKRVRLEVLEQPRSAELVEGRKKTRPIFLFVLVLSATVMLAFALENLRPTVAVAEAVAGPRPASAPAPEAKRKTA